jgi:hypothetical protein
MTPVTQGKNNAQKKHMGHHPTDSLIEPQNDDENYNLLIITPCEFSQALQPLVCHKNNIGISTRVVTLHDVYDQMFWHGRDKPEKIKYFIKHAIEEWGIKYVLLVGDFRRMPIRYVHNQDVLAGFHEPVFIS